VERLEQRRDRPLTLVVAAAGYGKATLVASWLETCDCPSAWLSQDEDDDDLALFPSCFSAAIPTTFPDAGCASPRDRPPASREPKGTSGSWRVLGFFGLILVIFLLLVGTEVLLLGPDLRPDGLHGIIAPRVLGFNAQPVMMYDLAEDKEPWGALFLGSQGDLYVVYDPCTEEVSFLSVSSTASRIALIDEVDCYSP
jgi:hypothetical protein